ncbi:AcvB/VirJ family lysyl-phosphatidylglycerol hydrolase [Rhodobacter lacus]|uniref:AcvB/VirJ family lysyl-phosphatidylglycerol hydrolase n=1 Tax=Rhodobacter lacus TaxID=1641972 RepID=A0ABW5AC09_9RHOB
MMKRLATVIALGALVLAPPLWAGTGAATASATVALPGDPAGPRFDLGMIPPDHILRPDGAPKAMVVLISDQTGWQDADETTAEALRAEGAAVIGIDLPSYLRRLDADPGDCVYMVSDIESLAHQLQRAGGGQAYATPILAGTGAGGTLALDMIAQSPLATIDAGLAVDPRAGLALQKTICTDAPHRNEAAATVYDLAPGDLPAAVEALFSPSAPADGRAHLAQLQAAHPDLVTRDVTDDPHRALLSALRDRIAVQTGTDSPLGLPLTIYDAKPAQDTMVVFYSGDGGWRDIDMQVGTALQASGVPVVGVDSLRYFWSERTAKETAEDLVRIITAYRAKWHVHHVVLAGYSFGADILPATYDLLPPKDRKAVAQVTLMGLSHQVDYQVSVDGWLGLEQAGGAGDPLDDIARMDRPDLVQCFYGAGDDDDACHDVKTPGIEPVAMTGGHHFDGNYDVIAKRIIADLSKRLAGRKF